MKSIFKASVALALLSALTSGCGGVVDGEADSETSSVQSPVQSMGTYRYDGLFGPATQCPVQITEGGVSRQITLHCCASGEAMIGAQVDANVFKCAPVRFGFMGLVTVDRDTQRFGMHACPYGKVMIGYHHDWDILLCAQPYSRAGVGDPVTWEGPDYGTIENGFIQMHVCPLFVPGAPSMQAMSGIRYDENTFLCAF